MQVATNDPTVDPPASTNSTASKNESWKIVEVLEVLLDAVASTSAVFSELWIPHGTCAKLPPTEAKVSANTILQ